MRFATHTAAWTALALAAFAVVATAQGPLPLEPIRERGASVTPAFEGWYPNPDGTFTFLVGYFNRNQKETLDIPIGANNRIEPGGPDLGQPTHFLPRRQWGVFTVRVPRDFGTKKLTWTLTANGETTVIPLNLHVNYQIEPFRDPAMGNTPPIIRFEPGGRPFSGPPVMTAASYTTTVGQPLGLTMWVRDQAGIETPGRNRGNLPPATLFLSKHRGPGDVVFSEARPKIDFADDGRVSTTATFGAPGEYVLRVQANDASGEGGGGFQCCWTNAHVTVIVRAGGPTSTGGQ
jgi:hypothetical protein